MRQSCRNGHFPNMRNEHFPPEGLRLRATHRKLGRAVSIIETDVSLEFEASKDYTEAVPQPAMPKQQQPPA
jgi:hypothetical protein